ncbi:uncharacterized protein [Arachis hypogaea]|uniref:uncharacterized protein n=1 Tax=Arachis hypogaea TaxID=3818 RepID=UPI003B220E40
MDPTYLKWTIKLLGLDFEIRYRPGLENKAADALSRQMMARAISVVHMNLWETVEEEVAHDQELQKIVVALQQGLDDYPVYSLHKGWLFYQGRAVLPANSSQIPLLLAESHDSGAGGHSGFFRTYKRLAAAVH